MVPCLTKKVNEIVNGDIKTLKSGKGATLIKYQTDQKVLKLYINSLINKTSI